MVEKILKIKGMHCVACAMNIDGELEDLLGVNKSETSFAKQETRVYYDENMIASKQIEAAIRKIGYETE